MTPNLREDVPKNCWCEGCAGTHRTFSSPWQCICRFQWDQNCRCGWGDDYMWCCNASIVVCKPTKPCMFYQLGFRCHLQRGILSRKNGFEASHLSWILKVWTTNDHEGSSAGWADQKTASTRMMIACRIREEKIDWKGEGDEGRGEKERVNLSKYWRTLDEKGVTKESSFC